jgi:hypothetical protein
MAKLKVKIPKALKKRIKEVSKNHDIGSVDDVVEHFIVRGLKVYGAPEDASFDDQMEHVVDDQGYSSVEELVEHLLLRGLRAYEETDEDPAALQARLRGLGYID